MASMMARKERLSVWTNAYAAALTGLLSKKIHDMDRYTPNKVSAITDQCKAFADKALSDVAAHDEAGQ